MVRSMARRLTPFAPLGILVAFAACSVAPNEIDQQLLRPPLAWLAEPADFGIAAERVEIELHREASLTGFWLPAAGGERRTVVLFHDADVNASAVHPYWRFLHDAGFSVLAFDPRGYGKSRGTSTFRTWLYDVPALLSWLRARPDVDPQRIAFFGTGLGSLAAYWAARTQGCQALVVEHLPSLREMLREAQRDDGTALSALSLGFTEAAKLPDEIEPEDVAGRVRVPTLFVASDGEPARDRKALVRTFQAHAGQKQLWLLAGTGRAPHGMLTHDGEYQARIAAFLATTLGGTTNWITTEARKVADARSGGVIWEVTATPTQPAPARVATEVCAVLADGSCRFANTWLDGARARVRLDLPSTPVVVTAVLVPDAVDDAARVFRRPQNARQLAALALEPSWIRIEALRNGTLAPADRRVLRAELEATTQTTPFPRDLEAELGDVWALLGKDLATSADPAERADGQALLQRAVAAVPTKPHLHTWPGPLATYGYPQEMAIDEARRLLAAPPK